MNDTESLIRAAYARYLDEAPAVMRQPALPSARPRIKVALVSAGAAVGVAAVAVGATVLLRNTHTTPLDSSSGSSSTLGHGSLTDHEFSVAVAVARAEADKDAATITSATATVGKGTVTDPNDGPPCTSGTLLHIKLIGTFPTITVGLAPTAGASSSGDDSVSAVLITADPESGKACDLSVQTGPTSPDPGATLLFTK